MLRPSHLDNATRLLASESEPWLTLDIKPLRVRSNSREIRHRKRRRQKFLLPKNNERGSRADHGGVMRPALLDGETEVYVLAKRE